MEIDKLKVSRVIAALFEELAKKDVTIQLSRDFAALEKAIKKTNKKKLTEHFRRNLNTYSPQQAMWLGGLNSDGKLVALAAARLDVLGSWSLAQYWREYWPRCYPDERKRPVELARDQYRYANEVSGDVVYLGEMWVCEDHPKAGIANDFSPAILALSLLEWQTADYFYAWVRPGFLDRGFGFKCGFTETHPGIKWKRGPSTIDQDLWVMASNRSQLADQLDFLSGAFLSK